MVHLSNTRVVFTASFMSFQFTFAAGVGAILIAILLGASFFDYGWSLTGGRAIQRATPVSVFSCVKRPYGFYADVSLNCRTFHICNPQVVSGKTVQHQFTYDCPAEKVFDQLHLACVPETSAAAACENAEEHYGLNEAFTLRAAALDSRDTATSFSCDRRPAGSYADVRSGCRAYFVCKRIKLLSGTNGVEEVLGFRLSCPIPTVFDQRSSSCRYMDLAVPCEDSEKYFAPLLDVDPTGGGTPFNLSPRSDLPLLNMPEDSVFGTPVGNKLLSSEVVLAGLGLQETPAYHAVTASNGAPVANPPPSSFSCDGRMYGYYADVELGCRYFHVCTVSTGPLGKRLYEKHSFVCPKKLVFDQLKFECGYLEIALPCSKAERHYDGNSIWND